MTLMSDPRRALRWGLAGVLATGAVLAGAGPAAADPVPPVDPVPVVPVVPPPPPPPAQADAMTPNQPALPPPDPAAPPPDPAAPPPDPAAPPPPPPGPPQSRIPPVPNAQYGSGKYGGGVFGTLKDLWDQAQNPFLTQDALYGSGEAPVPPPGAGPAPKLPPGYVSTNAPGSETPSTPDGPAGPATGRPALPPGYYPLSGPPPPGYEYGTPAVPPVPVPPVP